MTGESHPVRWQDIPNPWREVAADPKPTYMEGSHNGMNRSNSRTARWWELTLSCGHFVERNARLVKEGGTPGTVMEDVVDPPKKVRCERCGGAARQDARRADTT